MRYLLLAVALMTLIPVTSPAQEVQVTKKNLVSVLSGYHEAPGEEYWRNLEPETTKTTLIDIATDTTVFTIARARALLALQYFADDESMAVVAERAVNDPVPYMRATAVEALSDMKGEKRVELLSKTLSDKELMVRLTAINSLKTIGTAEARSALENHNGVETDKSAREIIGKALSEMK